MVRASAVACSVRVVAIIAVSAFPVSAQSASRDLSRALLWDALLTEPAQPAVQSDVNVISKTAPASAVGAIGFLGEDDPLFLLLESVPLVPSILAPYGVPLAQIRSLPLPIPKPPLVQLAPAAPPAITLPSVLALPPAAPSPLHVTVMPLPGLVPLREFVLRPELVPLPELVPADPVAVSRVMLDWNATSSIAEMSPIRRMSTLAILDNARVGGIDSFMDTWRRMNISGNIRVQAGPGVYGEFSRIGGGNIFNSHYEVSWQTYSSGVGWTPIVPLPTHVW